MPSPKKTKSTQAQSRSAYRIGFDLGGTKMLAGVIDENNKVIGTHKMESLGYKGSRKGLQRMILTVRKAMKAAGVTPTQINSIGIACPAVVDMERGILLEAASLGWNKVAVGLALQKIFKTKVAVLNDVDAGTYAEYYLGAGKGARTVLGVFPGTGVGGGCVYDGKLIRGRKNSAMEIGNMRLLNAALTGNRLEPQRMEDLSSRLAMAINAAREAYRGNAPHLMKKIGTDLKTIKSRALFDSVKNGDKAVEEIVDNAIALLGISVAGVVDLLAPDRIVLGGGLAERFLEKYKKGLNKALRLYACPDLAKGVKICPASLGSDAVLLGASLYAEEHGKTFNITKKL